MEVCTAKKGCEACIPLGTRLEAEVCFSTDHVEAFSNLSLLDRVTTLTKILMLSKKEIFISSADHGFNTFESYFS